MLILSQPKRRQGRELWQKQRPPRAMTAASSNPTMQNGGSKTLAFGKLSWVWLDQIFRIGATIAKNHNLNLGRGCFLFKEILFHQHRSFCRFPIDGLIRVTTCDRAGQKCGFLSATPILATNNCGIAKPSWSKVGSWTFVCKQHLVPEGGEHPAQDSGGSQGTCVMCEKTTACGLEPAEQLCGAGD